MLWPALNMGDQAFVIGSSKWQRVYLLTIPAPVLVQTNHGMPLSVGPWVEKCTFGCLAHRSIVVVCFGGCILPGGEEIMAMYIFLRVILCFLVRI
mmetsp:Transcript_17931/g.41478  ORF Transcript_17931/g.41478 Transcript_17931/m.41478 type:complete len:95 (+) Transcript_17931:94-378(+)